MNGTEKQIKWANDIIENTIQHIDNRSIEIKNMKLSPSRVKKMYEQYITVASEYKTALRKITNASLIICHRNIFLAEAKNVRTMSAMTHIINEKMI